MPHLKKNFFKYFILFIFPFFIACNFSDTYEAEPTPENTCENCIEIKTPTIWKDKHDDPDEVDYLVDGPLIISSDLTLEPGVVIAFKEGASLTVFCEGSLNAVGTESKHIIFRGEDPVEGFWQGLKIILRFV